jgi:hypothetical protein
MILALLVIIIDLFSDPVGYRIAVTIEAGIVTGSSSALSRGATMGNVRKQASITNTDREANYFLSLIF